MSRQPPRSAAPLRIGNSSGFYGDRFTAVEEMLTGGPLDVLTGDYLAELTMLILGRDRLADPARGYAKTYLRQLETTLGTAHDRGVALVSNAGGLNPAGLAARIAELAEQLGIPANVAYVTGDDLTDRDWTAHPGVLTANAYLGGHGIAACLRAGADVVVTGRVTDAALVSGPATAHFGWADDDWDALAGAVAAGHVLECGTQATGGNYAFFGELDLRHPGFPLAEIHPDGSAVITKHPGTGGAVTRGTVTAQLLYETGPARYPGPDVTTRLDTVQLTEEGPDRVRISGVRGEPPPPTAKAGLARLGGYRNELVFALTGLDIEEKAALLRRQLTAGLSRPPAETRWTLARTDHPDAATEEEASALLRLTVRDPEAEPVGRQLTAAVVELALASYPGFHLSAPPGKPTPYGVFTAVPVPAEDLAHTAVLPDGSHLAIPAPPATRELQPVAEPPLPAGELPTGPVRTAPLGRIVGARSGDKGGDANLGVWTEREDTYRWLCDQLTAARLRELLPETARLPVQRTVLPRLRALNFHITGLLGDGAAAGTRFDPQAKALGEWLRSRRIDIPEALL